MIVRTVEIRNHIGLHAHPSYLLSMEAGKLNLISASGIRKKQQMQKKVSVSLHWE